MIKFELFKLLSRKNIIINFIINKKKCKIYKIKIIFIIY